MNARQRLDGARRAFLDTAPVIYFVEANPQYLRAVEPIFRRLDSGTLEAVTSPVTLAECLVHPLRHGDELLAAKFTDFLTAGPATSMMVLDERVARRAAELRAAQSFSLTDAMQLAAAVTWGCDVFLTNDTSLAKAPGVGVLLLDELLGEGQP